MKRKPPDSRNALSALRLSLALSLATLIPLLLYGSAPSWWSQRDVLIENTAPDDYAPANQGQLKNIAKAAVAEMDARLPGGAGDNLRNLISSWSTPAAQTNDFAPVNLGQLKAAAKPFYDRLFAVGLASHYPWTNGQNPPDDFTVANIGQIKNLFSFELPAIDPLYDGDHNGLPDAWERRYFGGIGVDPNGDADGDGISNLQEYLDATDPSDFFNGALTNLSISGGGDQRGNPGTLLSIPFSIRVSGRYSYAIGNAPVTMTIERGSARLLPNQMGTSLPSTELTVRANAYDNDGYPIAQAYILLPSNPDMSVIRASAQGGGRSVSVVTTAVAIDSSLVAPSNLLVTATSPSSARLTWVAPNNTTVTTVQASLDGGRTWITLGAVAPGMTHATITGLTPNQTVRFRLFSGGASSVSAASSFALPDPSSGPVPVPPPGPGGGTATESVEVSPLRGPVMEIETQLLSRFAFGFNGLLGQGGGYRDQTVLITSDYARSDGTPDPTSGSTTVRRHWQRSDDGGSAYVITTTDVIGGGGYLNTPWTTVTNTDTLFRQEGAPFFGYTGGSSRTITLSNPYTQAELKAEGDALAPSFYDEFRPAHNDATAFLRRRVGYQVRFLQFRFKVNADPNLVVIWDIQFTPDDGGPVQHDIESWSSDGSTQSPTYFLDPRTHNGGKDGTYNVVLVSAELMVDGNRDSEMSFDEPSIHDGDQTSEEKPYRFWVNDDDDGSAGDRDDHVPPRAPDYADGTIKSIRDLEDFARLQVNVSGMEAALESNTVQAAFEWRQTSNNPRIKLYRATSAGTDYLTDELAANSAMLYPFRDTLGEVAPGVRLFMPPGFWVTRSEFANVPKTLPQAWFLFEASGEGRGELILSFWRNGSKIGETPGAWLELKNIKKLYQHQVLGGSDPWAGFSFEPVADEQKELLIFVHGWRLSPNDTANFAETMFKRVWWRGFKGRFVAVRWDTYYNSRDHGWLPYAGQAIDAYLSRYNDSEHNAWLSGPALSVFVNSLPSNYRKDIVAHSMGNVVTGSALQNGMNVSQYALLNAALPASCYDEDENLKQAPASVTVAGLPVHLWNQVTPEDDPDIATRALAYRGRLRNVRSNLISFYLPDDYATSFAWELNNALTKPPGASLSGPFLYKRDLPSGKKLIKGIEDPSTGDIVVDRYIVDPYEAQPYACRTWGKAVGAEGRISGRVSTTVDLSSDTFSPSGVGGFSREHSAEFNFDIQKLRPFYTELLTQLSIPQNP